MRSHESYKKVSTEFMASAVTSHEHNLNAPQLCFACTDLNHMKHEGISQAGTYNYTWANTIGGRAGGKGAVCPLKVYMEWLSPL